MHSEGRYPLEWAPPIQQSKTNIQPKMPSISSCSELHTGKSHRNLYKLLQSLVSKLPSRRTIPDAVAHRIHIYVDWLPIVIVECFIGEPVKRPGQNFEGPKLASFRLHVLQGTSADVRIVLKENTRSVALAFQEKLIQPRGSPFGAIAFDYSEPLMEVNNYAVKSAAFAAREACPTRYMSPWNKLHVAVTLDCKIDNQLLSLFAERPQFLNNVTWDLSGFSSLFVGDDQHNVAACKQNGCLCIGNFEAVFR